MTKQECLANAAEAEAMLKLVSFRLDKERLRRSAIEWRERASALPRVPGPTRIEDEAERR